MSDDHSTHPTRRKRAGRAQPFVRAYIACEPCRRTKAKCEVPDPAAPCVKCTRERRECYFSASRSTKKRQKKDPSQTESESSHAVRFGHGHRNLQDRPPHAESANRSNDQQHEGMSAPVLPDQFAGLDPNPVDQSGPVDAGLWAESGGAHQAPDGRPMRNSSTFLHPTQTPGHRPSQTNSQSGARIETEVMRTYVSSSKDALGLLFKAAEQREDLDGLAANHDNTTAPPLHDSPASTYTSGAFAAPLPPSKLSSPSAAVVKVWDACRFIRQGWFSAREAVTYIDLFFANLAPFSPILDSTYSKHENHKTLIYHEPLLCCTLLMISSRYHVLPGPGGVSRAHYIHMRLWAHCEHLIKRLTFGQEKYSIAKSRTMASIESLLLMTEWHPRALHFPPDNDGWDSSLGASNDDPYANQNRSENINLMRWREEVFEPAKRSDRMSWMILGLATSLALELGVWDSPSSDDTSELAQQTRLSKLKIGRLLFVYGNQLASRIGCTSLITQANIPPINHTSDLAEVEAERQKLITHWIDLTKLLRTATEMFSPSKSITRELLKSGRYVTFLEHLQPLLTRWQDDFSKTPSNTVPEASKLVLLIEYQYVRMYINSWALQAIVDRLSSQEESSANNLNYDFLEIESSQDYKYVQEVIDASRQILQTTESLADAGILRYSPVRVFLRITSATIFLLKAISLGARNAELSKSLDIVDRCIRSLRSSPSDDIHLSSRYGILIERHVALFRRNFCVQSRTTPGMTRPHSPFPGAGTTMPFSQLSRDNNSVGHAVNPSDADNLGGAYDNPDVFDGMQLFTDDWLAQPFDSSFAPFGMGPHQSASGFEMDSLDFLWNLPA